MIETERLLLRPLKKEDAESVFDYASDDEITTYLSWDHHKTIDDSMAFIDFAIKQQKEFPLMPLGIILKERPDWVIGTVGIKTGANKYEAELAYALSRKHWRKGIMYEAASALVKKAFEDGYKRVMAWCVKENIPSSSLMKKLGMKYEGCLRQHFFRHGQFQDVEYYGVLEEEWRFLKSYTNSNMSI